MAYFKQGSLFKGISTVATAGGTTTLVASPKQLQQFTGTQTQTVALPDATTLVKPRRFDIFNRSTQDVTVNANGGGFVATVPAGSQRFFLLTDNSSAAGVWQAGGVTSSSTALSNEDKLELLNGMAGTNSSTDNVESRLLSYRPEEVGGNFFYTRAPIGGTRGYHSGFMSGGYGFINSGYNGSAALQSTERFDDDNNYWLARQPSSSVARYSTCAFTAGSYGFIVGGNRVGTRSTDNERYNPDTNSWSARTSIALATDEMFGFSLSGLGWIGGGYDGSSFLSTVQFFDDTANVWYNRGATPILGRGWGSGVLNGSAYIFGAYNGSYVNNSYKLQEVAGTWSTNASLTTNKSAASSGALNGFLLSIGGNTGSLSANVQHFSDATGSWVNGVSLATAKSGPCHNLLNGVISGGNDAGGYINVVESYVNVALINVGIVKRAPSTLTSMLISTLSKELANTLAVQVRTDGGNWKNLRSGVDEALKDGESYTTKFLEYPLGYASGGGTGTATTDNERYNDVQNSWDTRTALTAARRGPYYFTIAGLGYIAGGENAAATLMTDTYVYTDTTNAWASKSGVLPAAKEEGASFTILGLGYAVCGTPTGGTYTDTNYQYNASTDAYSTKTVCPIARRSPASFTLGDWGYIAGGVAGSSGSPTYTGTAGHKYNPITDAWTALGNLATGVGDNSGGFAINNYGYSVAGFNGTSEQTTVQRYSPVTNTWASAGNLNTARSKPTVYRIGEMGYVSGGAIIANHEQYNPTSQTSTNKTSMNVAKVNAGAIGAGNYRQYEVRVGVPAFYVGIGGYVWNTVTNLGTANGAVVGVELNGVSIAGGGGNTSYEAFDKSANAWIRTANTPSAQAGACYFALQGQLYIASGVGTPVSTTRYYNHVTKAWATTGNVNIARSRMYGNGRSLNGFGYMFGGQDGGGVMRAEAEQYNPASGSWTTKASMTGPDVGEAGTGGVALGMWYRFGGFDDTDNSTTNIVQAYSDASNAYITKGNYPTSIKGLVAKEVVADKILLGTGSTTAGVRTTTMYEYNAITDAYATRIPITGSAIQSSAFDGTMFAGGDTGSAMATVYRYTDSIKNAVLGVALEIE